MCIASRPNIPTPPPPLPPPPPPVAGATELQNPIEGKRKPGSNELKSLRIPLNPTGFAGQPRIG